MLRMVRIFRMLTNRFGTPRIIIPSHLWIDIRPVILLGGAIATNIRADSHLFSHTLFGVYRGLWMGWSPAA
jgi:hypothetical protein